MASKTSGDKLKIAIIAPPWLSIGPGCYFGIENMLHNLVTGLRQAGHQVEVFTVGKSTTKAHRLHFYHAQNQYKHIHRPYYQASSIVIAHVMYALNKIKKAGNFDIIHDHNDLIGPAIMAHLDEDFPPILHTIHNPFSNNTLVKSGIPDNRLMYEQFKTIKYLHFNCVSQLQVKAAPIALNGRMLGYIHNGIDPDDYEFRTKKKDFFISVGSIKHDKGQASAAKYCQKLGEKLFMAGIISGGITTPKELKTELQRTKSPYRNNADFKYFTKEVMPRLKKGQIEYIGVVKGKKKLRLLSQAKALLMPINWEEPFGIVVIEALASGTPVVTYHRGAMPELIQHGVNGFLAKDETEFKKYMKRVGEIDPEACRHSVEKHFSAKVMANSYIALYEKVLSRTARTEPERISQHAAALLAV